MMKLTREMSIVAALTAVLALTTTVEAGKNRIVDVSDFREFEVYCQAFEVKQSIEVDIYAVGAGWYENKTLSAYGWIIRSGELEPIWIMDNHNTDEFGDDSFLREYQSSMELEPGTYEAYFYAGVYSGITDVNINIDGLKDLYKYVIDLLGEDMVVELEDLEDEMEELAEEMEELADEAEEQADDSKDRRYEAEKLRKEAQKLAEKYRKKRTKNLYYYSTDLAEEYLFEITTDSDAFSRKSCIYAPDPVAAQIIEPDHDLYSSAGFTLIEPTDVEIVAIGEYSSFDDLFVDHGWLIDAESRKQIWSMNRRNTYHVGGDRKNRGAVESLRLDKGDYVLYYVTDDSHSFDDWNAAPPFNPLAYGISVTVPDEDDMEHVKPYRDSYSESALLDITRVGDDEVELVYFEAKQDCNVRVYAIGEWDSSDDEFCDYAWIEKAGQATAFWEMDDYNTRHAGGAAKNRLFDDVVHLPKGVYTLGYVTDGSHSYADWNSTPPYDQKNYGVTLYAVNEDFDRSQIEELREPFGAEDVLVQLTHVGDDSEEMVKFSLDKPSEVRIYALGEGDRSEMYDFGWIESVKSNQIIWEMTYRKSRSAGGAKKNRMTDVTIMLDAGEYEVWYVTDGSHSFSGWNADRPRDPYRWGITVTKAGDN